MHGSGSQTGICYLWSNLKVQNSLRTSSNVQNFNSNVVSVLYGSEIWRLTLVSTKIIQVVNDQTQACHTDNNDKALEKDWIHIDENKHKCDSSCLRHESSRPQKERQTQKHPRRDPTSEDLGEVKMLAKESSSGCLMSPMG